MHKRFVIALVGASLASGVAMAETQVVNDQLQVRESQLPTPKRGSTMDQVQKQFGAPVTRHPTVGQPPITRWDYNGFAVVFEHDRVIDAVITGADAAPAAAPSDAAAAPAPQQ
jgi:hypothetical protein